MKITNEDLIKMNNNIDNYEPLNIYLNCFGIYNKELTKNDIIDLHKYIENTKLNFDPNYIKINDERDNYLKLYQQSTECPLSNKDICKHDNCKHVKDWSNANQILYDDKCFKKIIEYCDSLDSIEKDRLCGSLNTNAIHRMALHVDHESKFDNQTKTKEDKDLRKKLRELGLTDIYLDKSIRSTGMNDKQMQDLINNLLKTKDLTALNKLYDADAEKNSILNNNTQHIDYSSLNEHGVNHNLYTYDEFYKKNETTDTTKDDVSNSNDIDTEDYDPSNKNKNILDHDLITLDEKELAKNNAYDNIVKQYEKEKVAKGINDTTSSWLNNIFS